MFIEGYIPQVDLSQEFATDSVTQAVYRFEERFGGSAIISSIDGRVFIGKCEDCNGYIFGDDKYALDPVNYVIVCEECVEKESRNPAI